MEIEFYGATRRVTGSCHILRAAGYTVLLDCGLVQGSREVEALNREPFPFEPSEIDAVVLSHGHIDHSGRLPLLVNRGFRGPIYTHHGTIELCEILLRDSATLSENDARFMRKHGQRDDEPLYTVDDAQRCVRQMEGVRYGERREVLPGIAVTLLDAGHILASAFVKLEITEGDATRTLVFSGDLGQYDSPILNNPDAIAYADVVLVESTYGDRLHRNFDSTVKEIGEIIETSRRDCGNILIPAFSIGRSQELLYLFGEHYREWELEQWQVFLDSPMAIEASRIYWLHEELWDAEARLFRRHMRGMPPVGNLHLTRRVEESMKINELREGAIIIAGSGMCNGGRIVHHLKRNIERPECHIIITGFQAEGTLGREIVEGRKEVRLHGRSYRVRAQLHTIGGLSAHGDRSDLLRWLKSREGSPQVMIVHGEEGVKESFKGFLRDELSVEALIPKPGDRLDLVSNELYRVESE
ncbi:MAG TPA: MBL fold metallo-hydrolase [Chlorobaculum sp.]|uniref:Metallo-beta-lactamase superfamily protein n=1 Tax=Chlorobaculum tepidum (strain ATCC 49652 / DSM 12025 / NBRC 103806 / TLS) TaxID=194439 RepID=Q8KET4_CHLTE|nr:MBL fold metallo-hydrolase [Chlorobaculum tepidum]AAM71840.1 metallo-beta-lactamase superfamily protein [Chlorobaculum tepidum TLS]HBU24079.1 MBL fold metallo-hydrolase [Chlorobaculum sp.]